MSRYARSTMSTRELLVAATSHILRRDGLARLSTRSVSREAGVSESALYKHFATKEELLLAAIEDLVAPYSSITAELPAKIGLGSVEELLSELAVSNYHFVLKAGPIWSSLHADPQFHQRFLALQRERDQGPHHSMQLLSRFIGAEQRLGRINPELAPDAVADLVMAIAHFHASLDSSIGRDPTLGPDRVRATLIAALSGLLPRPDREPTP